MAVSSLSRGTRSQWQYCAQTTSHTRRPSAMHMQRRAHKAHRARRAGLLQEREQIGRTWSGRIDTTPSRCTRLLPKRSAAATRATLEGKIQHGPHRCNTTRTSPEQGHKPSQEAGECFRVLQSPWLAWNSTCKNVCTLISKKKGARTIID